MFTENPLIIDIDAQQYKRLLEDLYSIALQKKKREVLRIFTRNGKVVKVVKSDLSIIPVSEFGVNLPPNIEDFRKINSYDQVKVIALEAINRVIAEAQNAVFPDNDFPYQLFSILTAYKKELGVGITEYPPLYSVRKIKRWMFSLLRWFLPKNGTFLLAISDKGEIYSSLIISFKRGLIDQVSSLEHLLEEGASEIPADKNDIIKQINKFFPPLKLGLFFTLQGWKELLKTPRLKKIFQLWRSNSIFVRFR